MTAKIERVFDAETIQQEVAGLGQRLQERLGGQIPLFLTPLGGSLIFLADLVRYFGDNARFEPIRVVYQREPQSDPAEAADEVLSIHYPIPVTVRDCDVVLVKDVVHSGLTESYLLQQFRDRGAASVRLVALIDQPAERKMPIEPDDRALAASGSDLLVGYGLKYNGLYGNLPYIGRLTPAAPSEES